MDAFVLKAIAAELDAFLRGGTVERVLQPNKAMIILEIKAPPPSARASGEVFDSLPKVSGKTPFRLLVSTESELPRVHLTSSEFVNPKSPPSFCMLLRKHLIGARVVHVTLRGIERIVNLTLEKRDPVGRIQRYTFVCEVMGRHSNLFLVDTRTGIILDALKAVPPGKSAPRPIQRNAPYVPPPAQEKNDPLTITQKDFLALAKGAMRRRQGDKVSARWLVETFAGFSPDVAAFVTEAGKKSGLWKAFQDTRDRFVQGEFSPGVLTVDQEDQGTVWVLPVPSGKRFLAFPSANAAADELYGHSWETRRLEARRRAVQKEVQTVLGRRRRTADQVRRDQTRAAGADSFQRRGEVLLANLDSIPKGASSIRLLDPVTEDEVDIPLDVTKTAQQNAQRYFTRAKKLRRMAVMTEKRLKELNGQIDQLVALGEEVESTTRIQSFDGIEAKLREGFDAKKPAAEPGRKSVKDAKETQRKRVASPKKGETKPASKKKDRSRPKKAEKKKAASTAAQGLASAKPAKAASEKKKKTARAGPKKGRAPKVDTSSSAAAVEEKRSSPAPKIEGELVHKAGLSRRRKSTYYRCYPLKGGWEVLVGKNDRGNDRLLRQVASAEDVWLHAQGVPGSHVIIHHSERGKEVPVRVLEEAARLAAFFSKGKQSGKLAVDYTTVKNLRRVRGGRAGQVTYSGQRTILVSPKAPEDQRESDSSEKGSQIEEAV